MKPTRVLQLGNASKNTNVMIRLNHGTPFLSTQAKGPGT